MKVLINAHVMNTHFTYTWKMRDMIIQTANWSCGSQRVILRPRFSDVRRRIWELIPNDQVQCYIMFSPIIGFASQQLLTMLLKTSLSSYQPFKDPVRTASKQFSSRLQKPISLCYVWQKSPFWDKYEKTHTHIPRAECKILNVKADGT